MPKTEINWEEHRPLCTIAADRACRITPFLRNYWCDIVCELESRLWEVCNPSSDDAGYDESKGAFSTYAMAALFNYCDRQIRRHYIGPHATWVTMRERNFYSITDIGYATMHNNDEAVDRDRKDVAEVANSVLNMIGGESADVLERAYVEGERQEDIGKYPVIKARSDARMFVSNLRKHNPKKYQDCIETLGRNAV